MQYNVNFTWDDEARVWIATSEDIRGLVLEGGSLDALMERVKNAIPELLSLNGESKPVSVCYKSEMIQKVYA